MKNRNTKDIAGNHIYAFILSLLCLIMATFFHLRSIPEVGTIFLSLALNLLLNWAVFRFHTKKKLKYFTEYYNNLQITMLTLAAFSATFVLTGFIILLPQVSKGLLILLFLTATPIINRMFMSFFSWEKRLEILVSNYRLSISDSKNAAFEELKTFIREDDSKRIENYIESNRLFDKQLEDFLRMEQGNRREIV